MIQQKFKGGGLKVEALQNSYANGSICYIDQYIVDKLYLSTGSIIEIQGKRKTAGIVIPSIGDKGKKIIRLDDLQRFNAGVKVGDFVSIRKRAVFPAEEIEFTPTFAHIDLKNLSEVIKSKLIDKPLVKGDIIDILRNSHQTSDPSNQINQIMNLFRYSPKFRIRFGLMTLVVENTKPSNEIVRVTKDTRFKINNRIAKLDQYGNSLLDYNGYEPGNNLNREREIIEELLLYTGNLEERLPTIEIEKQLIHLERQRLEYGKRILNNAIERMKNITNKLMDFLLLSSIKSENIGIPPDMINNIKILDENITKIEHFLSKKPEEGDQNPRYCRYCGERVDDNPIYCPHCGAQIT